MRQRGRLGDLEMAEADFPALDMRPRRLSIWPCFNDYVDFILITVEPPVCSQVERWEDPRGGDYGADE